MFNFPLTSFGEDTIMADRTSDLYLKSDIDLKSLAMKKGILSMFQPSPSRQELIQLLKGDKDDNLKSKVWNMYIGQEIGQHPCLICGTNTIIQSNFHCSYGTPKHCGGTNKVDNLLPTCGSCNINIGTKTIAEYSQAIKKPRLLFLSEKMKRVFDVCIIEGKIPYSHQELCRTIATNPMLWNQFEYLYNANNQQKIKIKIWKKMIILDN